MTSYAALLPERLWHKMERYAIINNHNKTLKKEMTPEPLWRTILCCFVWPILKYAALLGIIYMLSDTIIFMLIIIPLFLAMLGGAFKDGANIN